MTFIDDDLTDVFGPGLTDEAAKFAYDHLAKAKHQPKPGAAVYEEDCPKCKGSGKFVSYTGRIVGNCFHCKGTGKVTFKTSPEARAKNAEQRAAVEQRKRKELAQKSVAWAEQHDAEWRWMIAKSATFGFAGEMVQAVVQWGALTDKQLAAVRRCMVKDADRDAERQEIAERAPDIAEVALAKIEKAFASAIDHDIKYPKLRLDRFIFSLVRSGVNAGSIYVKSIEKDDDGDRTYFGKIVEGRFFRAFKCDQSTEAAIIAAASDPEAAAVAYGRREGACSICGRKLTNHTSIDLGIGPICYNKFFS